MMRSPLALRALPFLALASMGMPTSAPSDLADSVPTAPQIPTVWNGRVGISNQPRKRRPRAPGEPEAERRYTLTPADVNALNLAAEKRAKRAAKRGAR